MAGSIPVHLRHFLLAVVISTTVFAFASSSASAAARLLSSIPGDGDALQQLETIEFDFDTLLLADRALVTVTRLDGTSFPVDGIVVDRTMLKAIGPSDLPSGNYEIGYVVRAADGSLNDGSIRVSIDAPGQAFSGGLLAIIGIAAAMTLYMAFVFRADKMRRRKRPRPS